MVTTTLEIPQFPLSNLMTIYPTPPPFSSHVYENNEVTSKKTNYACENKQLTSRTLAPNPRAVSI
jgi:hypothetical protein